MTEVDSGNNKRIAPASVRNVRLRNTHAVVGRYGISLSLSLLLGVFSAGSGNSQTRIPEALEPWREWVLYGLEYQACPPLNGSRPGESSNHICAWPGELSLDVTTSGATFSQEWELLAETWVPLPGDSANWPIDVLADGAAAAVVSWDDRPSIRLEPGLRNVSGALRWNTRPAAIAIPSESALVSLRLDGTRATIPERDGGTLWLGIRPDDVLEEDRLDVVVYRLLSDGLPITLETSIQIDAAGQNREVALSGALLPGFTGERLEAELPTQLGEDGTLRVQINPGRWTLSFVSRAPDELGPLDIPQATEPWPDEEIWSFDGDSRLRVAGLEGAPAVDAALAGVPLRWGGLPAYQVSAGQSLNLVERSRNDADMRNALHLKRSMWMDFDGNGYTTEDTVYGSMHRDWRLDMADPYVMTMASVNGENLLVTEGVLPGTQGVELRQPELTVLTTSRIGPIRNLAVTGYLQSFDSAAYTLNLPPAHRLMAAPGADVAAGAWLNSWRLLDIFLALIVAVAAWHLFGAGGGIAALITMLLLFQEPLAPRWLWLNALIAVGMFRAAPTGRLRTFGRWYRNASLLALIAALVPFVIFQARAIVFPQLELEHARVLDDSLTRQEIVADPTILMSLSPERAALEEIVVSGSRVDTLPRYQPGTLVQTGPGLPDWRWNTYTLAWSGPIDSAQSFRMVILSPWSVAIWRLAGLGSAIALLFILLRPHIAILRQQLPGGARAMPVLCALLALPQESPAQELNPFPSPDLLQELQRRLVAPAPCHPACAEITSARVTLQGAALNIDSVVAVGSTVAVPIPGSTEGWRADSVLVNGQPVNQLYRYPGGTMWLRLDEGVHDIVLMGPVPGGNSFALPFPLVPKRIEADTSDWEIVGIVDGKLPSGSLEFVRRQTPDDADDPPTRSFPPFVRIVRNFSLGLNWSVLTQVHRIAPTVDAFTVAINLLPGEVVLSSGIETSDGRALVALESTEDYAEWESRLPTAESLELTAPANVPWAERWQFVIGPIWNAQFDGIPRTPPAERSRSSFAPEYDPRPGESLTLTLTQPQPSSGDTIALDKVEYLMRVGDRSSEFTLELDYRSTRGMQHVLELPEDSELTGVLIDSAEIPLRLEENRLQIPVNPGSHTVEVSWRMTGGVGVVVALPHVNLGVGASNLSSTIELPEDRWILHAYGPTLGPAVLYWPELLLLGLAAVLLGRFALSPLGIREWLLLGVGLSTFAWPILLLFAAWAFVLSWRGKTQIKLPRGLFNGMQVGLGMLTLVTLAAVVAAIPQGLLGEPDMQISAPSGFGPMTWFSDRVTGLTPTAGVVTISIWYYRVAMLAWALWLSFALMRWIPWAWRAYNHDGIWRGKVVGNAG